jgi:DNA-binding transcriptional MerR regulator
MQLDMLQDDLFSDPQDTQQSAPSDSKSTPSLISANPEQHKPVASSKAIDLLTAQISAGHKPQDKKEKPADATAEKQKIVEQEIPSTATLVNVEPDGSKPIGSVLPVLGSNQMAAASQRMPMLESSDEELYADEAYAEEDEADEETVVQEGEDEGKAPGAFKTISEVAGFLGVPQHVLRFWESRFSQIKPMKSRGGRRYYRPEDIEILSTIKHLLYKQGYTIKGAKKVFSTRNREALDAAHKETAVAAPVVVKKVVEKPIIVEKPMLDDKKKKQLSAIRNELLGLRESLSVYLA